MKDKNLIKLDNLNINDESKEVLISINKYIKESTVENGRLPALIISSEPGCGLSNFVDTLSEMIEDSGYFPKRGGKTSIELVFPKDNEEHEKLFYSSAKRIATTTNRFYGVMCVSLKEFQGKDLIMSNSLENLIEFIEANRVNIMFVFHVLPEFRAKEQLKRRLMDVVNVKELSIMKPSADESLDYLINKMKKKGQMINKKAEEILKEIVEFVVSKDDFGGYKTLNVILDQIEFELGIRGEKNIETVMRQIKNSYDYKLYDEVEYGKVGFRI